MLGCLGEFLLFKSPIFAVWLPLGSRSLNGSKWSSPKPYKNTGIQLRQLCAGVARGYPPQWYQHGCLEEKNSKIVVSMERFCWLWNTIK